MEIFLDEKLTPIPFYQESPTTNARQKFIDKHAKVANRWDSPKRPFVEENMPVSLVWHANYLEYLELAYAHHRGVVLSPDHIWYTLLCELAGMVAEEPERYRTLFTTSAEKQQICVDIVDSNTVLPLDSITEALTALVPAKFAEPFCPTFSTTQTRERLAMRAAFADLASPYYEYSMMLCGIPFVDLTGTPADWRVIENNWQQIRAAFATHTDYFDRVAGTLHRITGQRDAPDPAFIAGIFTSKKCGSGSEQEISGWFPELFRTPPADTWLARNFASHVSQVSYKNLSTKKAYVMKQGLFSSAIDHRGYLVPSFSHIVYEDLSSEQ